MTDNKAPSKRPRKPAASAKAGETHPDTVQAAAPEADAGRGEGPKVPPREAAVEALMRLAAEQPWNDIEVSDIAREAGLTLAELRDLFPSKGAVLGGLTRIIDRKVLEGDLSGLEEEPTRERLFDVLMRRLDAMEPYKPALRRIAYALRGEPLSMLALNGVMLNSHRYMLAAAGIDSEGPGRCDRLRPRDPGLARRRRSGPGPDHGQAR
jgi:AcrR family transcriptional regulator